MEGLVLLNIICVFSFALAVIVWFFESDLLESSTWFFTLQAPWWAYIQAAIGLFVYQTLDATDGKQARRLSSSSPLGELFDHGCDSMTQGLPKSSYRKDISVS